MEDLRARRFRIFPTLLLWELATLLVGIAVVLVVLQVSVRSLVLREMRNEGLAVARMLASIFETTLDHYPPEKWTSLEVQTQLMHDYQEHAQTLGIVWAHIYDREFRLIFSPDPSHVGKKREEIEVGRPELENHVEGTDVQVFLVYPEDLGYLQAYISGPVVEVYYPIPDSDMNLTIVEVYMDASPFLRQMRQISLAIGGTLVAAAGLLAAVTYVLTRRADRLLEHQFQALEEAYAKLKELQEMRNQMTRMLSHDLRNYLAIIMNGLETLCPTDADIYDARADMRVALEHSLMLLQNLQDLERLREAQMPVRPEAVRLLPLVQEVYRGLRFWDEAQGKDFSAQVQPDTLTAWADAELLRRVLTNLLHNAFRYTPEGGQVRVQAQPGPDGWVEIQVQDSGPGIPEDYRERIFQPFFRVPGRRGGSGLGLAFCKLAVEAMGGRIWVESREGQGTTFVIHLPKEANANPST